MIQFDAAPPVPSSYARLVVLTAEEVAEARRRGYIEDDVDPSAPVRRRGLDMSQTAVESDDIEDWRARMYCLWFCYVFENFNAVRRPLSAVEELFLEFQTNILDDLAQLYAGAGAQCPIPMSERVPQQRQLKRYYDLAIRLLADWERARREV